MTCRESRGVPLELALIIVPTLVLAWASYRLVELPALAFKRGWIGRRASTPETSVGSGAIAAADVVR